jgi:hypothetical protein
LAFIGHEKAFDHVIRPQLWRKLIQSEFPTHATEAIKSLYTVTKIRSDLGNQTG